jgi:type IV pilus assembly protein PilO
MAQISLSRLPWWGQILAFVILAAASGFGFWYYYASEVQSEIEIREQRLATLRNDINRGIATAKRLPQFRAQVDDLERRLEALKAVLPDQKDYADVLRRVQTLATQSNLTIRQFQPKPVQAKAIHEEWPISLELDGTYHNLGMFFDRISKFPRIINVSALSIEGRKEPQPNATIAVTCTATTFVLIEPPAETEKPAPGKKGAAKAPRKTA